MSLETGTYIADLNPANPASTDPVSQGDDQVRLLKTALRQCFPGWTGSIVVTGTDAGVANAHVLTPATPLLAYSANLMVLIKAANSNTVVAPSINISGLGAKAIKDCAGGDLLAGDLVAGQHLAMVYDGTAFRLLGVTKNYIDQLAFGSALPAQTLGFLRSDGAVAGFTTTHTGYAVNEVKSVDVASAATLNLSTATGNLVHVTGTTAITAITIPVGAEREMVFDGVLTLTNSAALICPGGGNITTAAGDCATVRGEPTGARITKFAAASGRPVVSVPRMLVVTSSQPFTVPAVDFEIELQAAGAGGGAGSGAGGTSGGYAKKVFRNAIVGATAVITLGAKGTGGAGISNSTNPGTNAQGASFALSGFTTVSIAAPASAAGQPGAVTGGDINIPGQRSLGGGYADNGTLAAFGGSAMLGFSSRPTDTGSGYGFGGGGGATVYDVGGTFNSGPGADGGPPVCIIRY